MTIIITIKGSNPIFSSYKVSIETATKAPKVLAKNIYFCYNSPTSIPKKNVVRPGKRTLAKQYMT